MRASARTHKRSDTPTRMIRARVLIQRTRARTHSQTHRQPAHAVFSDVPMFALDLEGLCEVFALVSFVHVCLSAACSYCVRVSVCVWGGALSIIDRSVLDVACGCRDSNICAA